MEVDLSRGTVAAIWERGVAAEMPLVLQVVDVCPWPHSPGWYTAMLSDGAHLIFAGLRRFITDAEADAGAPLRYGDVVRICEYESKTFDGDKRYIISRQLEVLQTNCVMIGDPKHYRSGYFEDKNGKLDPQLVTASLKLRIGDYSTEQGLEERLTRGVVAMLQHPEMQVVGVTPMRSELKNFERYYLILSDGVHTQNATLEPHLNHLVKDTHLRRGTIVRLLNFVCYNVQNPSIIIVYDLKVLPIECELIGSPKTSELCCTKKAYGLGNNRGEPYSGSAANSVQPNSGTYFSCQSLKWYLTQGAVAAIVKGEMAMEQQPVLQVVSLSSVTHHGLTFYRILLSDGVHQLYANLFPHLSHLVEDNLLRKGARVRLLKFMCDTFSRDQNGRILIAVELEVLETECELIGSPTFYELGSKQGHPNSKPSSSTPSPHGSRLPSSGSFYSLTWGAVAAIWKDAATGAQPVLQVFDLLPYMKMEVPLLSPILLSDGAHLIRGGLPPDIISLSAFRADRLHRGTVVRLLEFMCHNDRSERIIIVLKLEVLQTDCVIVGNPKWYPFEHEDLSAESVSDSCKMNCGVYSAGQDLKEFLTTRGMVAVLQQPVMQVVDVLMMRSQLTKFEMHHLILSDSVHTQDATLAAHLNHLVKSTLLRKGTIVRLLEFMCNTSQSPSVTMVIQLEVLQTDCGLMGSPKAYEPSLFEKPYVPEGKYGEAYPRSGPGYAESIKKHLTGGSVSAMLWGKMAAGQQPVMQVVGISISIFKLWYRVSLSDGVNWMKFVLSPNLNELIDDKRICGGTIVRVLKFSSDTFENYRIFFLEQLEVLQKNCEVIGIPIYSEYTKFPEDRDGEIDWMPAILGHRRAGKLPRYQTQRIPTSAT